MEPCRLVFKVKARTNFGDTLVLVGSGVALGDWEPWEKGIRLTTTPEEYPVWSTPPVACGFSDGSPLEYKYVRLCGDGSCEWEAEGSNRTVPARVGDEADKHFMSAGKPLELVIEDGDFARIRSDCFGYPMGARPGEGLDIVGSSGSPQMLLLGDGIAGGAGAWCFKGWTSGLCPALRAKYGYGVCAHVDGLDVYKAGQDFPKLAAACTPKPTIVLIAFSAGLQHVATCPDWDREPSCTAFIQATERLIAKVLELGAFPVLAGLCPNEDCGEEQSAFWRRTNDKMRNLGVPFIDFLPILAKSGNDATWGEGLGHDSVSPNVKGHAAMHSSIDLTIFDPAQAQTSLRRRDEEMGKPKVVFKDGHGFEMLYESGADCVTVQNGTKNEYKLNAGWGQLQASLSASRKESPWSLKRGLYVAYDPEKDTCSTVCLDSCGQIGAAEESPFLPGQTVVLQTASAFAKLPTIEVVFADGPLSIMRCTRTACLLVMNEASFEYNVHPMWNEARIATRKVKQGVYEDGTGRPFRTAIVSLHGLQSRIKVPAGSVVRLKWTSPLSDLERVALLPLGDRCSIRMLLHKIELDGPCYPFDLTRTTCLGDVADIVGSGFQDMWNESLLHYDHDAGRIFHKKWGGLSYAHEVDDGDDPVCNFGPIAGRMAKRYSGRAARFNFACKHADRVMFIRTGVASRGEVENLLERLRQTYPGLKFSFLLISDQPSHEFHGIPGMSHVCEAFDPDRMYEDMNYWINSAHRFRGILHGFGLTERSLYWCPNNLREAEKEMQEAESDEVPTPPVRKAEEASAQPHFLSREDAKFSHSCLFDLEKRAATNAGSPPTVAPVKA